MPRKTQYGPSREIVLQAIRDKFLSHGRPPAIRELATAAGVGVATMHDYLTQMREEGLVEWDPFKKRSLRLSRTATPTP